MRLYNKISDLELHLAGEPIHSRGNKKNPDTETQKSLAKLLMNSEIYPPTLTREYVGELLCGISQWPRIDNIQNPILSTIDLSDLEDAGIVMFPEGRLFVVDSVEPDSKMPPTLFSQVSVVKYLYDISRGLNGFTKQIVRVQRSLISSNDIEIAERYITEIDENHFKICLDHDSLETIGSFYWKSLIYSKPANQKTVTTWLHTLRISSDYPDVLELEFDDDEIEANFLDLLTDYISADEHLKTKYMSHARASAINRHSIACIIKRTNFEKAGSNNHDDYIFNDQLDFDLLDSNINLDQRSSPLSPLDIYEWWESADQRGGCPVGLEFYSAIMFYIISHERNIFSPSANRIRTKRLISSYAAQPLTCYILFSIISSPGYDAFLLSTKETLAVGLVRIYKTLTRQANRKFDSEEYNTRWLSLTWELALDVSIEAIRSQRTEEDLVLVARELTDALLNLVGDIGEFGKRTNLDGQKSLIDLALHKLESNTIIEYSNHKESHFITEMAPYIIESIETKFSIKKSFFGLAPVPEWYILIWIFNVLERARFTAKTLDIKEVKSSIINLIITHYKRSLELKLQPPSFGFDDNFLFDYLDWGRIYLSCTKKQRTELIYVIDTERPSFLWPPNPTDERARTISHIRLHLRLLIRISEGVSEQSPDESPLLSNAIFNLASLYGFSKNKMDGIFDRLNNGADHTYRSDLWHSFVQFTNMQSEEAFRNFIAHTPEIRTSVHALLKLKYESISFSRKEFLSNIISTLTPQNSDFVYIYEIRESVLLAADCQDTSLAEHLFDLGNKNRHPTMEQDWILLRYQLDIYILFNNPGIDTQTKSNTIKQLKIPTEIATNPNYRELYGVAVRYQQYFFGMCIVKDDPVKAGKIFQKLFKDDPDIRYATAILSASAQSIKVQYDIDIKDGLFTLFNNWLETHNNLGCPELITSDLREVLSCLLGCKNKLHYDSIWNNATFAQRLSTDLALIHCEHLMLHGLLDDAYTHLNLIRTSHGELPDTLSDEFEDFEKRLHVENRKKYRKYYGTDALPFTIPSPTEARRIWLEIRNSNKQMKSSIFSNHEGADSFERFILENVSTVCDELIIRKNNLHRPTDNAAKFDIEDLINDWFISLLSNRLNYLHWHVGDQTRSGKSGSGKSVGEVDGWIYDQDGNRVSIIEAFKLTSLNSTTITSHINKISGYNPIGAAPILIIAYCDVGNFEKLCSDYELLLKDLTYVGFDNPKPSHQFITERKKIGSRIFSEIRTSSENDLVFYHLLLDLSSTIVAASSGQQSVLNGVATSTLLTTKKARTVKEYVNPHTGEATVTKSGSNKILKRWKEQYGADIVSKWCVP